MIKSEQNTPTIFALLILRLIITPVMNRINWKGEVGYYI